MFVPFIRPMVKYRGRSVSQDVVFLRLDVMAEDSGWIMDKVRLNECDASFNLMHQCGPDHSLLVLRTGICLFNFREKNATTLQSAEYGYTAPVFGPHINGSLLTFGYTEADRMYYCLNLKRMRICAFVATAETFVPAYRAPKSKS